LGLAITIIFIIGGIFGGLYLLTFRRMLILLKKDYPRTWNDLGQPEFGDEGGQGAMVAALMFMRLKDPKEDEILTQAKRRTWRFFLSGAIFLGGGFLLLLIRFLVSFFS